MDRARSARGFRIRSGMIADVGCGMGIFGVVVSCNYGWMEILVTLMLKWD